MAQKVPEVVQKLQQLARPTFVNGRWRKPVINARKLAAIRRDMVAQGTYWPPKPLRDRGGDKPFKLAKHEREREARQKKIEENMRMMPQMIADYRQRVRELREKTRQKKQRTEEEIYLIATGKMQQEAHWQIFKEDRVRKK